MTDQEKSTDQTPATGEIPAAHESSEQTTAPVNAAANGAGGASPAAAPAPQSGPPPTPASSPAAEPEGGLTEANMRFLLQIVILALLVEALAMPIIAMWMSGTATLEWRWTAVRFLALEAFTFLFLNILTGSFRPLFHLVFRERTIERFHDRSGVTGFALAVSHGLLALFFLGAGGYPSQYFLIGPAALIVLMVVVATALARRRIGRAWWWLHQINYVLFAALLIHGLFLGFDLGESALLKAWFGLYAIVAAAGLLYHISRSLKRGGAKVQEGPAA